ncbi:ribosome biogenesis GTPase Der [Candidatus Uhrbacteria bacterium]|nr:ribosome biogenesis GTPase Der [Candidatus Uhrbacteria bacterium]
MSDQKIPTVAIIGRTNVGKSTLFNRLLEKPKALVSDIAGTTRDRNEGECLWRGRIFRLVDTGGLDVTEQDEIERNTVKQAKLAIKQAQLILFVVDAKTGPLPQERNLSMSLKKSGCPVIVVANKAEKPAERHAVMGESWPLSGLPAPIAVSATRGSGIGDLLELIFEALEKAGTPPVTSEKIQATRVAVIGKPNVGKSTLLNALIGEERFITSPIAHTTREPNDILVRVNDRNYIFIDTAGMRKNTKVKKAGGLEAEAVKRNEVVVRNADVTLLVIDASEPIGVQEKTLAGFLKDSKSGVIVVANKWDLIEDKTTTTMNRYREYIAASIPFLQMAPVIFVSALTKQRVRNIYEMINRVDHNRHQWLDEKALAAFIREATIHHTPKKGFGPQIPKILGIKQTSIAPLEFDLIIKAKRTDALNVSYIRYLNNRLFETFKLDGNPIRLNIRIARSVSA